MKKKREWLTPNKMKISTGHGRFDQQTKVISVGNVINDTQLGMFIRPFNLTKSPAGGEVKPGELRDYDLRFFEGLPRVMLVAVEGYTLDEPVILYEFRHWNGEKKVVHGYVITTSDGSRTLFHFVTGPTYKSKRVIKECVKYVADDWEMYCRHYFWEVG